MVIKPKQTERLMYMHVLIREGRYPSSRTIERQLHVTRRTIYRDMHVLRNRLKAPLAYDPIRHGYYYTQRNWNIFE
ncbi:MAG: HTH domain-containing protein [Ktedonobacteraceae bacterium]